MTSSELEDRAVPERQGSGSFRWDSTRRPNRGDPEEDGRKEIKQILKYVEVGLSGTNKI